MNTKQLKAKVLDLAIHGKLLSPETVAELKKSPDYETADVLLEKIRKEKEEKIAKGELKRDKKDSYIFVGDDKRHYEKFADGTVKDIEDEIPFDVPEGWAWASLSEIANLYTGNSINENEKTNKYSNLKEGLFYIATKDIDFDGKIDYDNGIRIPSSETKFKIAPAESTLLCIEGGSAGRKIGFINQRVCFVNKLCCFHSDSLSNLYLFYYLQSKTFKDLFNSNKNGLIGGVSLNLLKSIFIPVAPIIEQDIISETIKSYLEKISSLDTDKETLEVSIKKAKAKILDLAIHGKLVPQDANDEAASVLLEKLRAEKEEKIAKGELKRDKNDSYIYKGSDNCYYEKLNGKENCIDDEIPFEIPESWAWKRGKEIFLPMFTRTPGKTGIFKYIDIDAIDNKQHKITIPKTIEAINAPSRASRGVEAGNVLFSMVRPYLENIALIKEEHAACIASTGFYVCRPNKAVYPDYLFYLMTSTYVIKGLNEFMKGDNSPSISGDDIAKWLYPIPPIEEQKRIVSCIKRLYMDLDQIQTNVI